MRAFLCILTALSLYLCSCENKSRDIDHIENTIPTQSEIIQTTAHVMSGNGMTTTPVYEVEITESKPVDDFVDVLFSGRVSINEVFFYDLDMDGNMELIVAIERDIYTRYDIYRLNFDDIPICLGSINQRKETDDKAMFAKPARYYDKVNNEYFVAYDYNYFDGNDFNYNAFKCFFYKDKIISDTIVTISGIRNDYSNLYFNRDKVYFFSNFLDNNESYPVGAVDLTLLDRYNVELENYMNQYELIEILNFDLAQRYNRNELAETIIKYSAELRLSDIDNAPMEEDIYFNEMFHNRNIATMNICYAEELDLTKLYAFPYLTALFLTGWADDFFDLSPLAEMKSLRSLALGTDFDEESLMNLTQIEHLNVGITAETEHLIRNMRSLKSISVFQKDDDPDYFSFLYKYENLEAIFIYGLDAYDCWESIDQQVINIKDNMPNVTFIYCDWAW